MGFLFCSIGSPLGAACSEGRREMQQLEGLPLGRVLLPSYLGLVSYPNLKQ